jgi:GntR family transcriptional regulator
LTINPLSGQPLYRQLADLLRRDIYSGTLAPGAQLPTERDLMDRHDASRNTIRLALGELANEGLIVSSRGRGHFVRDSRPLLFHATRSESSERRAGSANDAWVSDVIEQGRTPRQNIEVVIVEPPAAIAALLGIDESAAVAVRRRVRFVDDQPNSLSASYFPLDVVRDSEIVNPQDITRGANKVLDELGHAQVRYLDRIVARMPSPDEADTLRIGAGIPVQEHTRTGYDADDRAVRVAVTVLPTDRHVIQYELAG